MTNSEELEERAAEAVASILQLLDDRVLAERIDRPIDEATASFRFIWPRRAGQREFHGVIGAFVRHLHECCDSPVLGLPRRDYVGEAVALLQAGFQSDVEPGYDGAVLMARRRPSRRGPGIDGVLAWVAELFKAARREAYTAWVYYLYANPLEPGLRAAIVARLQWRHGDWLGLDLGLGEPFEPADRIPDLVEAMRMANATVLSTLASPG